MIHVWAVSSPRTVLDKLYYRVRNKQFLLQNGVFHSRLASYDKIQRHIKNPLLVKKKKKYFEVCSSESTSLSRETIMLLWKCQIKDPVQVQPMTWPTCHSFPLVIQFSLVPFHRSCFSWLFKFLPSLHCSYTRKALMCAAPSSTILSHIRSFWNNSPVIKASLWSTCKPYNQAGILIPWCYSCVYSYYLHSTSFKVTRLIQASNGKDQSYST